MTFGELSEILRRELGADLATRACAALCREAAGESVYVPRRPTGRPEIAPGETARAVQARYAVSERTARNWVNRWRS